MQQQGNKYIEGKQVNVQEYEKVWSVPVPYRS